MAKLSPKGLFEKILFENEHCVLASASLSGKPEAATIQYIADSKYNLYFETFPSYRKYPNLKSNPRVSIVVDRLPDHTIQMDGNVKELSGSEAEETKKKLINKYGEGTGYYSDPKIKFFKFTPKWIRILTDANYPPKYSII